MESTIKLSFAKLPCKFSATDIANYITINLQLKKEHIERVHYRPSTRTVYINVKEHGRAFRLLAEYDPRHTLTYAGKTYTIPITMDDGSIIVKLHDLPHYITNDAIYYGMERYGTVITMGEGRWTNRSPFGKLLNGYRYVQILLTSPIPAYVNIAGETTYVSYAGQRPCMRGRYAVGQSYQQGPDADELAVYRLPGCKNADTDDLVIIPGVLPPTPSREQSTSTPPTFSGVLSPSAAIRRIPRHHQLKREADEQNAPETSSAKQSRSQDE